VNAAPRPRGAIWRPSFASGPLREEGRREGRVQAAPMARLQKKSRRQSPQDWPNNRPSLRDGANGCSVLSQGTGLVCPLRARRSLVASATTRLRKRVARDTSVGVSGPHGLTVRSRIRSSARETRTATPSGHRIPRSTARDDRETPLLVERGTGRMIVVICPTVQGGIARRNAANWHDGR